MRLEPVDGDVGEVFFALADVTRRHVVERLRDGSTVTPSSLATQLPVTRQAVTKHLAVLDAAGLVTKTRSGRETHYRLEPARLTDAAAWIAAVGARWDDRLVALDALLGERRRGTEAREGRRRAG